MTRNTSTSWDPTSVPDVIRYPINDAIRIGRMVELADRLATDETPAYYLEIEVWVRYINGEADAPPVAGYGRSESYRLHPSNPLGEVA